MNALSICKKIASSLEMHEVYDYENKILAVEASIANSNNLPNFKFPAELREIFMNYKKVSLYNSMSFEYKENETFDFPVIEIGNVIQSEKEAFEVWYYLDDFTNMPDTLQFKNYSEVICIDRSNGEGGMLLMGHSEKYYGQIFFLNGAAFGDETTYKLADSLGEFLNKLT